MLSAVEDDGSSDEEHERKPPSNYVYDGNLLRAAAEIILDLCDGEQGTLSSVALERSAVPRYFDAIENQSLAAEELVTFIENSRAEDLGRQSLIDESYETVDLIVAVTDADREGVDELGDAFGQHASEGFEYLSDLADLECRFRFRISKNPSQITSEPTAPTGRTATVSTCSSTAGTKATVRTNSTVVGSSLTTTAGRRDDLPCNGFVETLYR